MSKSTTALIFLLATALFVFSVKAQEVTVHLSP